MRWNWLKALLGPKFTKPIRRERKFRPRVEELEVRINPVIGGQFELPDLVPGQIYNVGGTMLNLDGIVAIGGGGLQGTGSLMSDGLHILTAAHVAAGLVNKNVTFTVGATAAGRTVQPIRITIPMASQFPEPNFGPLGGNLNVAAQNGNDISLMRLVDGTATLVAPYYGPQPGNANQIGYPLVNDGYDAINQDYTLVGYGDIGTGTLGARAQVGTLQRHLGSNRYEAYGSYLNNEVETIGLVQGNAPQPPNGGKFILTYGGNPTAPIAWNATAAQVKAALVAIDNTLQNDLVVTGGTAISGAQGPTVNVPGVLNGNAAAAVEAVTWFLSFKGGLAGQRPGGAGVGPWVTIADDPNDPLQPVGVLTTSTRRLPGGLLPNLTETTLVADFDNGSAKNDQLGLAAGISQTGFAEPETQTVTLGPNNNTNNRTFRLRFTLPPIGGGNGQGAQTVTTADIAWNAPANTVRDALSVAATNPGNVRLLWDAANAVNNFTVNSPVAGTYNFTFANKLNGVDVGALQIIVGDALPPGTVSTTQEGKSDTISAPGDSGGPNFVNGQIAATVSGGTPFLGTLPDINPALSRTFGENGLDTNVGSFVNSFLMPTMNKIHPSSGQGNGAAATPILFDMGRQALGVDGVVDNITINVRRNGANLEIEVLDANAYAKYNGVYFRIPAVDVNGLTIKGGPDNETINVIGALGVGAVTVDGGGGANNIRIGAAGTGNLNDVSAQLTAMNADTLVVEDTGAAAGRTYALAAGAFNTLTWGNAASIRFQSIADYTLNASNVGVNTIAVPRLTGVTTQTINAGNGTNTFNVSGTNTTTTLNGGGANIFNVQGTNNGTQLTINTLAIDTVNVGSSNDANGTLNNIAGPVQINGTQFLNGVGALTLNVYDQGVNVPQQYDVNADSVGRRNGTMVSWFGVGRLVLNGAAQNIPKDVVIDGAVADTVIDAGGGSGTFTVSNTSANTITSFVGEWAGLFAGTGGTIKSLGDFTVDGVFVGNYEASSGTLRPGGNLNAGTLSLTGSFAEFAALYFDLGDTTSGSDLIYAGAVNLATVDENNNPVAGSLVLNALSSTLADSYTLVDNSGPDPVAGRFTGLPEGASVTVGGKVYTITYFGGDGNDIVLNRSTATVITLDNLSDGQTITTPYTVTGAVSTTATSAYYQIDNGPQVFVTIGPGGTFAIPVTSTNAPANGIYNLTVTALDNTAATLATKTVSFKTPPASSGPYDLVIDMNDYAVGQDSSIDDVTINVRRNSANLEVEVVDATNPAFSGIYFAGLAADILSLTIIGAADNELVNLIGLLGVGMINLQMGGGNNTTVVGDATTGNLNDVVNTMNIAQCQTLEINDPASNGRNLTVTANRISWGAAAVINFAGVTGNLIFRGGNGGDIFNIQATNAGCSTSIAPGTGNNAVNVGNANSISTIAGDLFISANGPTRVNINDRAGPANSTYEITSTSVRRTAGMTGTVSWCLISELNVYGAEPAPPGPPNPDDPFGGGGGLALLATTTYNLRGSFFPTNLYGGRGNDVFNVGSADGTTSTLDDIGGPVTINGGQHQRRGDIVNINDQGSNARTYTITGTSVARDDGPTITYNTARDIEVLNVLSGAGADIFNVRGTAHNVSTTLSGNAGNDTFNLGSAADTLTNLLGPIELRGGAGADTLNVNDQGAPRGMAYTRTNNTIQRAGTALITFLNSAVANDRVETVNLNAAAAGGAGNNVIRMAGIAAGGDGFVNAGPGDDSIRVTSADGATGNISGILGNVTIHGQGGNDTLTFNDQGGVARTYTVTDTTVTASGLGTVTFDDTETVLLDGLATGGNSLVVDHSAVTAGRTYAMTAATPNVLGWGGTTSLNFNKMDNVTLDAPNGGNNTINVNAFTDVASLEVNGGNAQNTFVVLGTGAQTTLNAGGDNTFNVQAVTANTALTINSTIIGDTVNIGSTQGNDGKLDGIAGTVQVNGSILLGNGDGTLILNVNDQGNNLAANNYKVTATDVSKTGGATINYLGVGALTVNGANQNIAQNFVVDGTSAVNTILNASGAEAQLTLLGTGAGTTTTFNGDWAGTLAGSGGLLRSTGGFAVSGTFAGDLESLAGASLSPAGPATPGTIVLAGSFAGFSLIAFDLGASSSGSDQIAAAQVKLTNAGFISAVLALNPISSTLADSYTLINNTGANPVSGTFAGLPEGTILTVLNRPYKLTYLGNDGNDVVLQAQPVVTITNPGDQTNPAGTSVTLSIMASSTTGAMLTFSQIGLPPGLSISGGLVSGTLPNNSAGVYTVTITATDPTVPGPSGRHSITFTWTVTAPIITFTSPGDQTSQAGSMVSLPLNGSSSLSYLATGLPSGLMLMGNTISGMLSNSSAGSYTVSITASDPGGSATPVTVWFTWTVTPNVVITFTSPGDQTSQAGSMVSLPLNGSSSLSYLATGLPSGLMLMGNTISGMLSNSSAGSYTVSITASDPGGSATPVTVWFTWTVTPNVVITFTSPGNQTSQAGSMVSLPLNGSSSLSYLATGLPSGLMLMGNTISGMLSNSSAGSYTVSITASDPGGSATPVTVSFTWTVTPNVVITFTSPGNQTSQAGSMVSLPLNGSSSLSYLATGLPSGLMLMGNVISGMLSSSAAGSYNVSITASDPGGSATPVTVWFTWTVTPNVVITFTSPGNQTSQAGSMVSLPLNGSSSLSYLATGLPSGLMLMGNVISGTLSNAAGSYNVSITASDPGGSATPVTMSFVWTVMPPIVTFNNPGNQWSSAGSYVNLTLSGWSTSGVALAYSVAGLPPGLMIVGGAICGMLPANTNDTFTVTISAFDPSANGTALVVTRSFTWTVQTGFPT